MVKQNDVRTQSISRIRIRTFEAAAALNCDHPKNTEEAQYNLAYPVAAALYDGQVGPRQVMPPRIFDNSLLELADKVEVEVASEFEKTFPQKTYAEVVIRTKDGRELSSGRVEPMWEPSNSLPTDTELEEKFIEIVEPILGPDKVQEITRIIWDFENIDGIRPFINSCIKGQSSQE